MTGFDNAQSAFDNATPDHLEDDGDEPDNDGDEYTTADWLWDKADEAYTAMKEGWL